MFGFLAACNRDLGYRSLYARCCQHQHRHYGKLSLPTLNYESVFLYAFGLDAGGAGQYEPKRQRCCMLQGRSTVSAAPDSHIGQFATSVGVLLTSAKLEDDVRDSRSWLVRTWKGFHRHLLQRPIDKAIAHLVSLDPQFVERIEAYAAAQMELERLPAPHLADFVRPTSEALGYLFRLMSHIPGLAEYAESLQEVGEHVGIAMVACDAAQDWQSDRRYGLPNPVRSIEDSAAAFQLSITQVGCARATCQKAFLKPSRTAAILTQVEQRVAQFLGALESAAGLDPQAASDRPGVVLHAVCCVPCGDGLVACDSNECNGTICFCCCCSVCCFQKCCN